MTKRSKLRILTQQIAYDIRQGIIYQWKKYAMLLIVYIVCIVSFIIRCKTNRHIESYTCGDMVMWMLKGMKKIETGRHMNIDISSVYIFPNVIIAFIVGNYIIKDLYGYGKSVLLKAGSRINWWISKCIWCLVSALVCYGMMYIVIAVAGICSGSFSISPTQDVCCYMLNMDRQYIENVDIERLMLSVMGTSLVMTMTLNMIQITIGLILSPTIGYMAVMIFLVVAAFSDSPVIITLYCMAVRSGLYMPSGYKIAPALVIMFIMIMVCAIAGAVYSSHMDIISKKAEWQNPD